MAMVGDATGAAIGVWQPGGMKGYELAAEPGTPAWHELHARDYAKAVKFYQDVFGWETDVMSDSPEFRYTTLGAGDSATAGSWTPRASFPAEVPASWQVYFAVEDTDAAIENGRRNGSPSGRRTRRQSRSAGWPPCRPHRRHVQNRGRHRTGPRRRGRLDAKDRTAPVRAC